MNPPISKIGVLLRPATPTLKDTFFEIQKAFNKNGIQIILEDSSALMIGLSGIAFEDMCEEIDALLSLGGDGTLLSALRRSYGSKIPAFGINIGHLGFLTAISPIEVDRFAALLSKGDYKIDEHMMLEGCLSTSEGEKNLHALNEVLISKKNISGLLKIYAKVNGESFNVYYADSLIIGTPTGSTAYNISAGGSVIYPFCRNILLTPISPHSLTQRPMVLNDEFVLEFGVENDCVLVIDGQEVMEMKSQDTLKIKAAQLNAHLIQKTDRSYFRILKQKFKWGEE
ncbi:NAD(+)/NADH kinase [Helicobacter cappadocius]|uniref:NAD kinase n=1 Tax=Helicobacter cappadocius TaxID=3063998 RepID=A0AA90TBW8_9HELI|nr:MULTISPECIES: NAD(+)/NADH kinase [unclassified Helicobacter]MDO7253344.1 NAD(+)/NADH kinase [Helicobacter sp. faydin-H75]MDP2539226.1 NAD(+)/NADH kinase [Helicobacter sp. faydin-H76]